MTEITIRRPTWSYIHLQHVASQTSVAPPIDLVTVQLQLTASLTSFLGLHGSSISIDILKLEGRDVWIRVPADDRVAVLAAVGSWSGTGGQGWRAVDWSSWSPNAMGRYAGQELFED